MADTSSLTEQSFFTHLPVELIEKILMFLSSYIDMEQAKLVCRTWHRLVVRICKQRLRVFYENVSSGNLRFRVIPQETRAVPSPRFSHGCCVIKNSMYIFGGCSPSNTAFNDVFELDLKEHKWTRLRLSGPPPPPKECATMVSYKNKVIVFGGWCQPSRVGCVSNARFHNDVHVLDIPTATWSFPCEPQGAHPCERAGHAGCVVDDMMVIFGGAQRQSRYNDVWVLDLRNMSWSLPVVRGKRPPGRFGHSQIVLNNQMVLMIGGCGGPNMLFSDVWLLDLKEWRWQEVEVRNKKWEAPQLWCHPAVLVQDKVVAFSVPKHNALEDSNLDAMMAHIQTYTLDCSKLLTNYFCSWLPPVDNYRAPVTTSLHSVVVGRAEILIFGGIQYSLRQNNAQNVTNTLVSVTS